MLEYLYGERLGSKMAWATRLRPFSSQTLFRIKTSTFLNLVILYTYPRMKIEETECSETSAFKIQTPGNYPEKSTQQINFQNSQ
jgi:hypothetical protein